MSQEPCVLLLGTCDTKLNEFRFMKNQLKKNGVVKVILVDVGRTPSTDPAVDISSSEVLSHLPENERQDFNSVTRGEVINIMIKAATILVRNFYDLKSIHGIVSLGGSGGTSLAAGVMRAALPFGFPKLIVSTVASGDTSSFVGESDIMMVPSIVDIAGLNSLLKIVLGNAAAAIEAMAKMNFERQSKQEDGSKPRGKFRIAITMFGVTTPGANAAMEYLSAQSHEVFVFHATGTGGRAMERLINEGYIDGVLDLTTTELADELVGGVMSAGSDRLTAAGKKGLPQIVSVGALDMVNFGARSSVPEKFHRRLLVEHNPSITLMRTTQDECGKLGEVLSRRLKENSKDSGKVEVWIPRKGISMMAEKGGKFYDEDADKALFEALSKALMRTGIKLQERDLTINDPEFAIGMSKRLLEMMAV
ncbi:non sense mediated decay [Hyphodiscus hymeniophilus]|uniref:Non sense mediated decay n=1 Tax=Hyphodiscus hymeniophilus TaxID=353542 RepID=A0A9P6VGV0_9HELO|nr:non sense mediated decay [Hyphodiscus hymeniophilus]